MDSATLRLWILFVGGLLIAGIYVWGKWQERRVQGSKRIEPAVGTLGGVEDDDWDAIPTLTERRVAADHDALREQERFGGDRLLSSVPEPARPPKELILTLSLLAPRGREFTGGELAQALRKAGMVYGDMKIFHAPADFERPDGPSLFSLANLLEPGTLEPQRLRLLASPGVVLFTQLPGPAKGVEIFNLMVATGRFLARELRGELCDERRQPLTEEKAEELRERILVEIGDTIRKPDFE